MATGANVLGWLLMQRRAQIQQAVREERDLMRILVACEFSATVRDAFRRCGHDAWSVDLEPTEGDPQWHICGDALDAVHSRHWDMMVAFPACTYLTKSNAWRWDAITTERETALQFVRDLMSAPIPRIAVENPVGAIGTHIRRADQYVQPWHFGEPYQKMTGLWLTGLPQLVPAVTARPEDVRPWCQAGYGPRGSGTATVRSRRPAGAHRRAKDRNRTFAGIARAMADQWGTL